MALADQGPTIEGGLKDHSPHGAALASGEQVGTSADDLSQRKFDASMVESET